MSEASSALSAKTNAKTISKTLDTLPSNNETL